MLLSGMIFAELIKHILLLKIYVMKTTSYRWILGERLVFSERRQVFLRGDEKIRDS